MNLPVGTSKAAAGMAGIVVMLGLAAAPPRLGAQEEVSGGNGTIYVAGYDESIQVIDESTMQVIDKIEATAGIPLGLQLSHDRKHAYSTAVDFESIEVFDLETRRSIGVHSLSSGDSRVRIWGTAIHPREEYLILLTSTDTKLVDRFEIGEPILQQYDLATRQVVRQFPWPEGEQRESAGLMFSPDGKLLYFFAEDVLIFDAESFEQVDKWEISTPFEAGLGRLNFGFNPSLYEEPGFFTSRFTTTDPVNGRRMMGVARINLGEKSLDFYTVGPSVGLRGFSLAPDLKKAYGLRQQIGDYEIWTFDLENRRVASRRSFSGRPRMDVTPSSNGELLYIHTAGNTIDIYDESTFELLRTVTLEADMTDMLVLPPDDERSR